MTANDTYLLLRAFCDELARCGVRHACTSPGSRCTPIVLSLVREREIRCWSHIDERCAGFFAVGAAKASRRPVAITCTSGTATANLYPAVIEAFEARVPLIVLTADRPPELRDVGAGQTIDQLKLYGDAVKWFVEVGVHDATPDRLRWIRALACRAYRTSLDETPGPVQLNFPLREPLVLDEPVSADESGRADGRPWVTRNPVASLSDPLVTSAAHPSTDVASDSSVVGSQPVARPALPVRGVIVAGHSARDAGLGEAVARFAESAGYPLLADPMSGARHGTTAIAHYDALLRDERFVNAVAPELVIRIGALPTSKPLRAWLAGLDGCAQLALGREAAWHDPSSSLTVSEQDDPRTALETMIAADSPDRGWLARWRAADDAAATAISEALGDSLSEPLVAARLGEWLTADATLFVASSMPVRDVELFFPAREPLPRVLSNRGANGIDGTVSAAFGTAAAGGGPVVVLIGDVALAHDIGGLLAVRRLGLALTLVLLNNDGGGIFHFLPLAAERDAFEHHIATPHGLDFVHAAALYGCGYERPASVQALRSAVERSLALTTGTTIIEVRTEREQNRALHRRVTQAIIAHTLRDPTTTDE
ncbi:MAG: 2-succinyl-5-enolpyruvyl-6-hydroxy-3-cyclohexene-1-carboxylic-acid synthase [Solirubrobacteraceae bacterium]